VVVTFSAFAFDPDQRQLRRAGQDVHLTPKAFDLLALLIHEAPRVLRKRELHEQLWPETFVSDATLVGLIKELRRALGDGDLGTPMIRTAHGVGYAFALAIERPTLQQSRHRGHWARRARRGLCPEESARAQDRYESGAPARIRERRG
jgi:DNA-binding winged helix-turn-helix (wHTH) protein